VVRPRCFLPVALHLTPAIAAAGEDITQFVEWAIVVYNSLGCPTEPDWNTLYAKEASLRAQLG